MIKEKCFHDDKWINHSTKCKASGKELTPLSQPNYVKNF